MNLYRKHRPQKFLDIVGQEHIKTTLANALKSGNFSHAYLFCGPKGSGKTTTARLLAKALNCTGRQLGSDDIEPCNSCESCKQVSLGQSMDVVEIDAASNRGIDEIRDLREKIRFAPTLGRYKVYVIDECHMLTKEAFNALLKTLEEPPSHAVFILATTELHKVPATIISRVQAFDFKKAKITEIMSLLEDISAKEKIEIEKEALAIIAKMAFGAFRDAVTMLDQVSTMGNSGEKVTASMVQSVLGLTTEENVIFFAQALLDKDRHKAYKIVADIYFEGSDLEHFTLQTINFLRKVILAKLAVAEESELLAADYEKYELEEIVKAVEILSDCLGKLKTSVLGQLPLEMAVYSITRQSGSLKQELIIEAAPKIAIAAAPTDTKTVSEKPTLEKVKSEPDKIKPKEIEPQKVTIENTSQGFTSKISSATWQELANSLREYNNTLAATLKDAIIEEITDSEIKLVVKFKFHAERISENKNSQKIEETLKQLCGQAYKVSCRVDPKMNLKKPLDKADELVSQALEVFEGDL